MLGKLADRCSRFSRWNSAGCTIDSTFSQGKALPIIWSYIEVNPFSGVTGSLNNAFDWIYAFLEKKSTTEINNENIKISNYSADTLEYENNKFDMICTDPPYYDNVPYANLSDFFYVWYKRIKNSELEYLFNTPLSPKINEIVELSDRNKSYSYKTKEYFEKKLTTSFKEMYRVLKKEGIAIIIYAHKTITGWEVMLNSLLQSGFVVTGSWSLHTERMKSLMAREYAALISSIYMVCRKIERQKIGFFNEIKNEIKERVETKLKQFWNEGISGGDFFISAIGPGMEIFSKYEKVEKFSGEQVSTIELLDYIRKISTDWITKQLLHSAESSNIDKEAQFYLAYRWTYLENSVPFDDALKLANASGINITQYWEKDGFIEKKGSDICVLGPKDRKNIKEVKNMVDAMHMAIQFWEKGDRKKLSETLSLNGYQQNNAFWQFCQAVSECLLDNSKEKTLLQGFLLGKDTMIKEAVSKQEQKELF